MSANKQKVIILGPAFPLRGGIANSDEALCRELNVQGVDAKIYSFSLQYPSILFPGKTQFEVGDGPQDITIKTVINSINPFNWLKVAKQIKVEKPDLVIVRYWLPFMGPCLGTIIKLVKRKTNIKVIAVTDNIIPHETRIGDKAFTNYFVKQCDGFVAMSKAVLEDLSIFTNNKNKSYSPLPIFDLFGEKVKKSEAIKHLNLNENEKHILFFGFIRKYKGLDLLLNAMADERIKKMGVKLIVAGEYYESPETYSAIIKENNLEQSVILKNEYIPTEEVKYYFSAADLIAQPYRTATQSAVTQIAYQFERPMLVTNVGGLPETVPHNVVGYVTAIDATSIADAIVDFYTNNKEEVFTKNVIIEKKRFLWSSFVEVLLSLYAKLKH